VRLLLAASVAALALASAGAAGAAPPRAHAAYLAHVSAVCRGFARRLERIPAPSAPGAYGDVIASLRRVVPLLRAQVRAMRAVEAPAALLPRLRRLFALDDHGIGSLQAALAAARRRDAGGVATGLGRFAAGREQVHSLAVALGIDCSVK
jgi:hypothetical protein